MVPRWHQYAGPGDTLCSTDQSHHVFVGLAYGVGEKSNRGCITSHTAEALHNGRSLFANCVQSPLRDHGRGLYGTAGSQVSMSSLLARRTL